jgi:hypothetical protein
MLPRSFEGERLLRIAALSHSGACLMRHQSLQASQFSLRTAGHAGIHWFLF